MKLTIGGCSHTGWVRKGNEDAISINSHIVAPLQIAPYITQVSSKGALIALCDGMGGHAAGLKASSTTLQMLAKIAPLDGSVIDWIETVAILNSNLYAEMLINPTARGMGTTFVSAHFSSTSIEVCNIGDSRAYIFSGNRMRQLSVDHTPNAAGGSANRSHSLTQSLGGTLTISKLSPHLIQVPPLQPFESILLCSDGLTDMADDETIVSILENGKSVEERLQALIECALKSGGVDNVSVILAEQQPS